jgi:non-canonical (house-cleaning) NTP pyrophosphatase
MGEALDRLLHTHDIKHREGAIGTFTGGLVTRQDSFMLLMRLALAPFRTPEWY